MGFGKMHEIEGAFPNMFPHTQFLEEAELKHGRMAMLAWTGVWATEGLGWHFPGAPQADDWTTGLGVWAREDPGSFGAILAFIAIAEGEGVSHAGDNFRGVSKKVPEERVARYKTVEKKNGRAAMIAMASLFAMKARRRPGPRARPPPCCAAVYTHDERQPGRDLLPRAPP